MNESMCLHCIAILISMSRSVDKVDAIQRRSGESGASGGNVDSASGKVKCSLCVQLSHWEHGVWQTF